MPGKCKNDRMPPVPIIVPALDPDDNLPALLRAILRDSRARPVILVDDGSGPAAAPHLAAAAGLPGVVRLEHPRNLGKGAAIKTAIRYCLDHIPDCPGVVTADSDGQHTPADILATAVALADHPGGLILGVRDFRAPGIPARSRLGNRLSRLVYRLAGVHVADTQTGLRGIPRHLLPALLDIPYDRYEFETAMLIEAARRNLAVQEQPIRTVYLNQNRGSHFAPLRDSIRIYRVLWRNTARQMRRFIATALASAALDLLLFSLLFHWLLPGLGVPHLLGATLLARAVSAFFNYLMNRNYVFRTPGHWDHRSFTRYAALCLLLAGASYGGMRLLLPLVPVSRATGLKAGVDLALFLISFAVQKGVVFRARAGRAPSSSGRADVPAVQTRHADV